ncbi:MAG TPA: hypothetical protein VKB52_16955 [Rhodanobacteraceae bacterium]|nr:hypothetical protein [Rhodanobacteraceae bacterium]
MAFPKYARPEIERRWLVAREALPDLARLPVRRIEDRYLSGGHLRLRIVIDGDGARICKLGKKYDAVAKGEMPIVSIYLSDEEADALGTLPCRTARKNRYALRDGSLDVYVDPPHPFAVFEIEFDDATAAAAFVPPPFAGREITGDADFSGFALADAISPAGRTRADPPSPRA